MRKKQILQTIIIILFLLMCIPVARVKAATLPEKVLTANPGDTAAQLQALLDYNKNGDYKLTIKIPAGTYELTQELRIYSNTTIKADAGAILKKNHLKGAMIANDMSGDKGGYITSVNITIDGGTWDSSKIAKIKKGTESFRFIHASNVTIKNATICNVPESSHLITFAGVKNGTVENCKLFGYEGTRLKEAIHLDIVHDDVIVPSMQSKYIVYDDLACDGILLNNNEIYDYPRAIGTHTSVNGVFHKNITISNNNLHDIDEAAIKAYQYVNLTINNNKIKNAGLGILVYTYIENEDEHYLEALSTTKKEATPQDYKIKISSNTIEDIFLFKSGKTTLWGDGIRILGSNNRPLSGVTMSGNTIKNPKRYGIFVEEAPNCIVSNNEITMTTRNGIYLIQGCNNSSILRNTVTKAGEVGGTEGGIGILASKQVTISENIVSSSAKNGIFLYNQSESCTISKNTITDSGESAIAVYHQSNDAIVTSNKIATYKKHGIFAYEVGSATINSNKITGKVGNGSADGIHIAGDNSSKNIFTVNNNTINKTNRYGMYINNAKKASIGRNTISNTMKHAIYLDNGSNSSKVISNKITNAGEKGSTEGGIGISKSSKVSIEKNTVKNAAKNGIFLYNISKNCTILNNTIIAAGDNAISVNNNSDNAKITSNIITGNKMKTSNNRGIFVYDANKASITKNSITGCKAKQEINISSSKGSMQKDNKIK